MAHVTIGVPVLNGAVTLKASLECLANQTYRDIAVIISNNGSTDATAQIAERMIARDDRFSMITHEKTLPLLQNFDSLLDRAESPLFMWRAHDDLSESTYIETLVETLNAAPGKALAFGRYGKEVWSGGTLLRQSDTPFPLPPNASSPFEKATHGLAHMQSSWIYGLWKTEALLKTSRDALHQFPYAWANDLLTILPLVLQDAVALTDKTKFTRRVLKGQGVAHAPAKEMMQTVQRAFAEFAQDLVERGDWSEAERASLCYMMRVLSKTWVAGQEGRWRRRSARILEELQPQT